MSRYWFVVGFQLSTFSTSFPGSRMGTHQKKIVIPPREECKQIFVRGLSCGTNAISLYSYFRQFGEVAHCMPPVYCQQLNRTNYTYITFIDPVSVQRVLSMNSHSVNGKKLVVRASYADLRLQTEGFSQPGWGSTCLQEDSFFSGPDDSGFTNAFVSNNSSKTSKRQNVSQQGEALDKEYWGVLGLFEDVWGPQKAAVAENLAEVGAMVKQQLDSYQQGFSNDGHGVITCRSGCQTQPVDHQELHGDGRVQACYSEDVLDEFDALGARVEKDLINLISDLC